MKHASIRICCNIWKCSAQKGTVRYIMVQFIILEVMHYAVKGAVWCNEMVQYKKFPGEILRLKKNSAALLRTIP